MFGGFFVPSKVEAGFLSSLLGSEAHAEVSEQTAIDPSDNSQTMALLEANALPLLALKSSKEQVVEDTDVKISGNALLPVASPMKVAKAPGVPAVGGSSFDQVSIYVVRRGDSLSEIAEMFDVSVNTILAANDMKKGDKIAPGDVLFILPISGIEHKVKKGETLQSIAKLYKVDIRYITDYNSISDDAKLAIGDELIIPGGEMADEGGDKPASNLGASVAKDKNYYATHPIQGVAGYFINPLPTGKKTQGLHGPGHRGIDIGAPTGTPIYAAASATVLIAKTGWSGGYGNMAILQHPNGTKTLYAHMTKLGTQTGAQVSQGDVIGYVGSTGHSTGPLLHFEVFNAKNPGADWSWAK